jgi:hypothetical protein
LILYWGAGLFAAAAMLTTTEFVDCSLAKAFLVRTFLVKKWGSAERKKKGAKKKETEGLSKLAKLMEIGTNRGFPQRFGKPKPLSTVPTRPNTQLHNTIYFFERQRSTLNWLSFGPKNGEHFIHL